MESGRLLDVVFFTPCMVAMGFMEGFKKIPLSRHIKGTCKSWAPESFDVTAGKDRWNIGTIMFQTCYAPLPAMDMAVSYHKRKR